MRAMKPFIETLRTGWWTTCLEVVPPRERSRGRFHCYREALPAPPDEAPLGWVPAAIDDDTDNGEELCVIRGLIATGERGQAEAVAAAVRRHAEEQRAGAANRSVYLARLAMVLGEEDEAVRHHGRGVVALRLRQAGYGLCPIHVS